MNKTIKSAGGVTVRVVEALNGFRRKHGYWPTSLMAESYLISFLATQSLTPLGFFLLQSKVDIVEGSEGKLIAIGRGEDTFDYGEEVGQDFADRQGSGEVVDARAWLGLDADHDL